MYFLYTLINPQMYIFYLTKLVKTTAVGLFLLLAETVG